MSHPASYLWIRCKDCFTILHNERGQERHGNYINGFPERNLIQINLVILEQKLCGVLLTLNLLSGFFINFTQQKVPRGTLKFYLFFEKKSHLWQFELFGLLFNVWLSVIKDIIWCLFIEINIQHRVIWFCEKASLRIYCIILCECRSLNFKNWWLNTLGKC